MRTIDETAVFIIHAIKQLCFGFEKMDELADDYTDGSAGKAFFLSAIYQHLAVFYLIDRQDKPMGGAFYPALARHELEGLLEPLRQDMEMPFGDTTFGEVLRVFRNKALVHPNYTDADLERIYRDVDMSSSDIQQRWQELLRQAYVDTKRLAVRIAEATKRPLSDFGIQECPDSQEET